MLLSIICLLLIGVIGFMIWNQNISEEQAIKESIELREDEFKEMRSYFTEEGKRLESEALEAISKNDNYRVAQLEVELDNWMEDYESYQEEYASFKNEKNQYEEQN